MMTKKVLLLVLSAFCPLWALAQFSGQGSGTVEDPYQITNAIELYQVRSNLSSNFILMNDIDLTDWLAENSPTAGWTALGSFSGVFDGQGHTVKYFTNDPNKSDVALFGGVNNGTIKDLNVIGDVTCISGGGIVGYLCGGTVSNCTFRGSIHASDYAGGIVGKKYGSYNTIKNSSVSGQIFVNASISGIAGGIVGRDEAYHHEILSGCSFWGNIYAEGKGDFPYAGGIVGKRNDTVIMTIDNCFFCGKVESNGFTGGIIGNGSYVSIDNCIVVASKISSSTFSSGISNNGDINSCVAIVDSIIYDRDNNAHSRIGSGAGYEGTAKESLALSTMVITKKDSKVPDKIKEGGPNGVSMGKTMLKMASTYASHNFDMEKMWAIDEGNGYPYLRCAADFMSIRDNSNLLVRETDISTFTDAIYANEATALKGGDGTLVICMKNAQATNAYSFDLVLPEGVTIDSYTLSSRHNGHAETMNRNETTGVYSFAVLSLQSKEVAGNDGAIWTLKLKVADNMALGDYAVKIQNAKYSLISGSAKVSMPETISKLTVENYVKGDVNGDGDVDIADAVCIVNHVVDKATPVFIAKAADVNGDGDADIADAVRIVNLVVGKISALAPRFEWNLPEPE